MDDQQNPIPSEPTEPSTDNSCAHCDEYLAGWKRAQADYQNLKKESEREKAEYAKYANERLLQELLPAVDQFGLALSHMPSTDGVSDGERKSWESWMTGLRAVGSLWDQAAKTVGLTRIPTDGSFDPTLHDAVGEEAVEGREPGQIVRVLQDGWQLHGKVLRPARVMIAK